MWSRHGGAGEGERHAFLRVENTEQQIQSFLTRRLARGWRGRRRKADGAGKREVVVAERVSVWLDDESVRPSPKPHGFGYRLVIGGLASKKWTPIQAALMFSVCCFSKTT